MSLVETQNYDDSTIKKMVENEQNKDELSKVKVTKCRFALTQRQREDLLLTAKGIVNTDKKGNKKHYLLIRTQLETGMRIGEIAHLPVDNINFIEHYIQIEAYSSSKNMKGWKPKTVKGNRTVPIDKSLSDALEGFIQNRKTYVFESNKGKCFTERALINMINKYARQTKSIGKNIGSHALRRTYASYLIHQNVPISEISHALGHKNIQITLRYLFEIQSVENFANIRKAISKMNPNSKKDD